MNKDDMNELKKDYDNIQVPPEVDLAIENAIKKGRAYKRNRAVKPITVIAAGIVLAFGIASVGKLWISNNTPLIVKDTPLIVLNPINPLPTVGSSENLENLLIAYISENNGVGFTDGRDGALTERATLGNSKSESSLYTGKESSKSLQNYAWDALSDHSTTNLQVQGVDEEDLVKTDGEYIFKVNAQKIINVVKVKSDSKMEAINNITFEDNYNINGIF